MTATLAAIDLMSREALRIAKSAENHSLDTHQALGHLARDMAKMREEMNVGFTRLEKRLERTNRAAFDSKHKVEEWESDSKIHLLNELKETKKKRDELLRANSAEGRRWKWWGLGIAAAIIAALIIDVVGHLAK